ncbi:hypothetical protein HY967_02245 [Candidatus Jorgensenbacteria bacterium]|nr:hypothetical protein [Candidatus Jorgensenbacteria bacterium]
MNKSVFAKSIAGDPAKLFKRELWLKLTIVGAVLVIGGAALFLFSRAITGKVVKLQHLRSDNKWLFESLQTVAQLSSDSSRAHILMPKLEERLPTALEVSTEVVPMVEGRALAAGLAKPFVQLSDEQRSLEAAVGTMSLTLEAEGKLLNIIDFIGEIERGKTIMTLSGLEIRAATGQYYRSKIVVTVYTRK